VASLRSLSEKFLTLSSGKPEQQRFVYGIQYSEKWQKQNGSNKSITNYTPELL